MRRNSKYAKVNLVRIYPIHRANFVFSKLNFSFQFDGKRGTWRPDLLKQKHGINSLHGLDGVSKHSVAIHLKDTETDIPVSVRMHRYHVVLHNLC
jgi:hypothetical protein